MKAVRRAGKNEPSRAIRVTGGDVLPAAAIAPRHTPVADYRGAGTTGAEEGLGGGCGGDECAVAGTAPEVTTMIARSGAGEIAERRELVNANAGQSESVSQRWRSMMAATAKRR